MSPSINIVLLYLASWMVAISVARRSYLEAQEAVDDQTVTCPGRGLQCIDPGTLAACEEEDEEPAFVLSCEALIIKVGEDDVKSAYCDYHRGACVLHYHDHNLVLRVRQISDKKPKQHQSNLYQRLTELAGLGDGFGSDKFDPELNNDTNIIHTTTKNRTNYENNVIYFGDHKIKTRPGFWERCSEGGLHCANPKILALCSGDSDNIQYGMECSGGFCDAVAEACSLGSDEDEYDERERRNAIDPNQVGRIIANLTGYHPENVEIETTHTDIFKNPLSIIKHPNSTALNSDKLGEVLGANVTLASSPPTMIGPGDVIPDDKKELIEESDKPLLEENRLCWRFTPNATIAPNITLPNIIQNSMPSVAPIPI